MASKRYKKLPKKTNELAPSLVEKLIPEKKVTHGFKVNMLNFELP